MPWYCLKTQPKREQVAARHISSRGLGEVYAPELLVERKTRTGKKGFRESLFPGYIFIKREEPADIACLERIPGARTIIRRGRDPIVVNEKLIVDLNQNYPSGRVTQATVPELAPGTMIEIVDGCFFGQDASVVAALPSSERVKVLLEFLGRGVEVVVPVNSVLAKTN